MLLRRRWGYVATAVVLMLGVAYLAVQQATPLYQSRASTYFTLPFGSSASDLFQASNYAQQQLASYASLATKPIVLQPVIDELKLDVPAAKLARSVSATASAETVIVEVTASSADPQVAADTANAVVVQLGKVVQDVSPRQADDQPAVNAVVVARATPAAVPYTPVPRRDYAAALLAGLLLGILAAWARDKVDTRVRSAQDMPAHLPYLGSTPLTRGGRDMIAAAPASAAEAVRTESFRHIRTNLRYIDVDSPPRVMVVTSAISNEGKTTTAVSLGVVFAELGRSTVVVDADLRRPRVAQLLGLSGAAGLVDVVANQVSLEDVTQEWSAGLSVLTSGPTAPNPSELLGSKAMADLLKNLRERYDVVILDAPPLLPVTDAAVLAPQSDGVVVVARAGRVTQAQLDRALDSLAAVKAKVLGVVLTMVPRRHLGRGTRDTYGYYGELNRRGRLRRGNRHGSHVSSSPVGKEHPSEALASDTSESSAPPAVDEPDTRPDTGDAPAHAATDETAARRQADELSDPPETDSESAQPKTDEERGRPGSDEPAAREESTAPDQDEISATALKKGAKVPQPTTQRAADVQTDAEGVSGSEAKPSVPASKA